MSLNIYVAMKNSNAGTRMFMYVVLHRTRSKRAQDAQLAAQIMLVKVQDRAQNELKYPGTDEKYQGKNQYVYVLCFAWDSSNFSKA